MIGSGMGTESHGRRERHGRRGVLAVGAVAVASIGLVVAAGGIGNDSQASIRSVDADAPTTTADDTAIGSDTTPEADSGTFTPDPTAAPTADAATATSDALDDVRSGSSATGDRRVVTIDGPSDVDGAVDSLARADRVSSSRPAPVTLPSEDVGDGSDGDDIALAATAAAADVVPQPEAGDEPDERTTPDPAPGDDPAPAATTRGATAPAAVSPDTTIAPGAAPAPDDSPPPEEFALLGSISMPSIGVDLPLREGITPSTLDAGPGHWPGTAMPGQVGNVVVAAHRTSHGGPFRNIDQLTVGDRVEFGDGESTVGYVVVGSEIVEPDAIWITDPTETPTATLFACHPLGSTSQRIVIHLELEQ